MERKKILLAIGGATGSGKTSLAIALAKKYPQLVIFSADSRQVYRELDVGTGKVGKLGMDASLTGRLESVWIENNIPQFLIDIAEPNENFSVADYQLHANRLIKQAWKKDRVPLLVGGTGLYIDAVTRGFEFSGSADQDLRRSLEEQSLEVLLQRLKELGGSIVATDQSNKRRVIRAIERMMTPASLPQQTRLKADITWVGILDRPWVEQQALAPAMVDERLQLGLIQETERLLAEGIDQDWLKSMGLSYRLVIQMLDGEFSEKELRQRLIDSFRQLMRRQRTWFKSRKYDAYGSADVLSEKIATIID